MIAASLASLTNGILNLDEWVVLPLVFLLPALESSAFIGFLFPGEIAVFVGGVVTWQGRLTIAAVLIAAIAGAVLGDTVGYWVGRRWGRRMLRGSLGRLPFVGRHVHRNVDRATEYVRRRGPAAVFLGRWTAALRVVVPGLAGMGDMHYPTFVAWNVLGGATWATAFVLLGHAAGRAYEEVEGYARWGGWALLAVLVVLMVTVGVLRGRRLRREGVAAEAPAEGVVSPDG